MRSAPIRVLELRSIRGAGGGPEKTILLGAAHSSTARFQVTVCYIRDAGDAQFDICRRAADLGVDYIEVVERGSFDPRVWPSLRRVVRQRAIQIVHSHDYKTDLLALMLARVEGAIPLATAHGWTGHSRRERWLYYPADKRLLRAFPLTIAVSTQIRADLIAAGGDPDRIRVVRNGIDAQRFCRVGSGEAPARAALGIPEGPPVIGAVGRLEPQKRFDLLIQAAAILVKRYPSLRVVIAGDGSLRADLQALGDRLLPPGTLTLLGHVADPIGLHHALDLLVQSSDYEGTPNAVLEAMALETPVVATDAGGTTELMMDAVHGLIVPAGDVTALAAAIEHTWLHRADTAARVARARRRVETELSFAARMAAVERLYEEVVARAAQTRPLSAAERWA